MLNRLWKGDVALWVTFWIFGVLILTGIDFLIIHIKDYVSGLRSILGSYTIYAIYALIAVHFIYAAFIFIAIWRSASKYTRWGVPVLTAKALVIVGVFALLVFPMKLVFDAWVPETKETFFQKFNKELVDANKRFPQKLDANTELYKVNADSTKSRIDYYFRLQLNKQEMENITKDKKDTIKQAGEKVRKDACSNEGVKHILSYDITVTYYYELEGQKFFELPITKNICNEINSEH